MAKLPLTKVIEAKIPLGDVLRIKGVGFSWVKPTVTQRTAQDD